MDSWKEILAMQEKATRIFEDDCIDSEESEEDQEEE